MSWVKVLKMGKEKANGKPFVMGKGNKNADTMLIKDMPGEKKMIIQQVLTQMGLGVNEAYITQVSKVKCVKVSEKEAEKWIPILQEEVKLVKPKQIIALGKVAKAAVFDGQLGCLPYKKVVNLKISFIARLEKLWKEKLIPIIGM